MDRKLEELLKKIEKNEEAEKKLISKDEMLEIVEKENLEQFGITIRL